MIPLRATIVAILAAGLAVTAAAEDLRFDKLDACNDLTLVVRRLNEGIASGALECRTPRGALERRVTGTYPPPRYGGFDVCLLPKEPAPMLAGFSCVLATKSGKSASLNCFREVGADLLDSYKRDYRTVYASQQKAYLTAARSCSSARGDTSEVVASAMDGSLAAIATFDFGFGSILKLPHPAQGMATHGFARIVPAANNGKGGAVEYFSAFSNKEPPPAEVSTPVGATEWRVSTDNMREQMRALNSAVLDSGAFAYANGISLNFRSTSNSSRDASNKATLLRSWMDAAVQSAEADGFDRVPDSELAARGLSTDAFRQMMTRASPGRARDVRVGSISVLVSEDVPCANRGGGVAVFLMSTPADVSGSDYGGLGVFAIGAESCSAKSGRTLVDNLVGRLSDAVVKKLGENQ